MLSPLPSVGRVTPFCEVLLTGAAAQVALLPASIAALPVFKGKYAGLPVRAPRLICAKVFCVMVAPHSALFEILSGPATTLPLQFCRQPALVLLATIVFASVVVPVPAKIAPAPQLTVALFPTIVLL